MLLREPDVPARPAMKVRVTEDNAKAIQVALRTVQTSRMNTNLVTVEDVLQTAKSAESRAWHLVGSYCVGSTLQRRFNRELRAATPTRVATEILLRRGSDHWFLIEVRRIGSSGADIDDLTLPAGSEPVVLTNELRRNFARIAPA